MQLLASNKLNFTELLLTQSGYQTNQRSTIEVSSAAFIRLGAEEHRLNLLHILVQLRSLLLLQYVFHAKYRPDTDKVITPLYQRTPQQDKVITPARGLQLAEGDTFIVLWTVSGNELIPEIIDKSTDLMIIRCDHKFIDAKSHHQECQYDGII